MSDTLEVQEVPVEQLKPAPWNPRFIRRDRLDNLKESIERDPGFIWRRPILATEDGQIYAGNQRYKAVVELGWKKVPAIVSDIPLEQAQRRGIRDNNTWGDWDDEALIQFVQDIASVDTAALATTGFSPDAIRAMLAESPYAAPTPQSQLPPPVTHRDRARADDDDGAQGSQEGLQAPLPTDSGGGGVWEAGTVRQIVLQYPAEIFNALVPKIEALREVLGIDNNTEAVTRLIEEYADLSGDQDQGEQD